MDDQHSPDTVAASRCEVRIVLVHGTWARGFFRCKPGFLRFRRRLLGKERRRKAPRWFDKRSFFSQQLLKMLELGGTRPVFEQPLLWTGRNSLLDRGEAARKLALRLRQQPDVPCLVVAHSHGGNVALRALSLLDERDVGRIRLITLATPFVTLSEVDKVLKRHWPLSWEEPPRARLNSERLQLGNFLLLSAIQFLTIQTFFPQASAWMNACGLLVMTAALLWVSVIETREGEALADKDNETCLARRLFLSASYPTLTDKMPHLLILRGVEDEASLVIGAAGALGRFMQIARDVTGRLLFRGWRALKVTVAALAMLAALTAAGYAWLYGFQTFADSELRRTLSTVWLVLSSLVLQPAWALTGLAVLARVVSGVSVGRELFWMPNLEVSVSTSPDLSIVPADGSGRYLRMETLSRRGRNYHHIRHQLYDDVEVIRPIVDFLGDSIGLRLPDAANHEKADTQTNDE